MTRRSAIGTGIAALTAGAAAAAQTGDLARAGLRAGWLATIPTALDTMVADKGVPGVVTLIWRKGVVAQVAAAGLRDIERGLPMTRDTIFRIASMTKPVTSVAALRLVEQGRMALTDPITRWAPEFAHMRVLKAADGPLDQTVPVARLITIEDLLTHHSGLPTYGFMGGTPLMAAATEAIGDGINSSLSPDAWLAALARLPLAFQPGDHFDYGHSLDVLGLIVGRVMGTSLREALDELVLRPLRMQDTDFWVPPAKRERLATTYVDDHAQGGFVATELAAFTGDKPQSFVSGGQGLVSTIDDYLTFARMLIGGGVADGVRLLKPETVAMMTANRLTDADRARPFMGFPMWATDGFGLGVSMILDEAGHNMRGAGRPGAYGWPGAFGGWWQADPAEDMILIWLIQALPGEPPAGVLPRMPGMLGNIGFQKRAYGAIV